MLAFYWGLFRDIPTVLRGTHEAWAYWLFSIAAPTALAIWPQLRPTTDSPWLIAAPVTLSLIYGMARVNYQRFKDLSAAVEQLNDKFSPAIAVEAVCETEPGRRVARLRIRNKGIEQIRNCTAQVLDVSRFTHDGVPQPKPVGYTHYAYLRWSRADGGEKFNTFTTTGAIDSGEIEHPYTGRFAVRTTASRVIEWQPEETSAWRFTIEVAAENSQAVKRTYEVRVEPLGQFAERDLTGYGSGYTDNVPLPRFVVREIE